MDTKKNQNKYIKRQSQYGDKKHYSHMSELEKDFLMREFYRTKRDDWIMTDYCWDRFVKRGVNPQHFLSIFKDNSIIEFHQKKNSNRILLRSKQVYKGFQVCACFNVTDGIIITVYLNKVTNTHTDLKEQFYIQDLDVLSKFKEVTR